MYNGEKMLPIIHLLVLLSGLHDDEVPLVVQPGMEVGVMFLSNRNNNSIYSASGTSSFIPNYYTNHSSKKCFKNMLIVCLQLPHTHTHTHTLLYRQKDRHTIIHTHTHTHTQVYSQTDRHTCSKGSSTPFFRIFLFAK